MADLGGGSVGMTGRKLRGSLGGPATRRQIEALAAYVTTGGSVVDAAAQMQISPSTLKRHLADARARFGLTTSS